MLKTQRRKFNVKRREFLKKAALAGITVALPGVNSFGQDAKITDGWYEQLAETLNKLPNSFPRTKSNIEIPLLKKIFLPEEAHLASFLTGTPEPADVIATRAGPSPEEADSRLKGLLERDFAWGDATAGVFRLAP